MQYDHIYLPMVPATPRRGVCVWRRRGEKNRHWKVKGTIADSIPLVCTQAPPHLQVADEGYGVCIWVG